MTIHFVNEDVDGGAIATNQSAYFLLNDDIAEY